MLSSKYFLDGDPFCPKSVDKPSYVWASMCSTARALREGFGWQVDNGRSISLCNQRWGFEGLDDSSLLQPSLVNTIEVVRYL